MPKKHKENLPKVYSAKTFRMLHDPRFTKEMAQHYHIDKSHDIPYLAGYSADDRAIYIDRHFPLVMDGINIEKYIVLHEKTEKALMGVFKTKYQQAHHIATHVEHMSLISDGFDWKKYTAYCEKYIKEVDHEKVVKVPSDLDLEPYKDEHDERLMKELVNASNTKFKKS